MRVAIRGLIALAVFGAATVLWTQRCSGPQPEVSDLRLEEPPEEGAPYRLEAIVRNEGPGHGQVEVTFRLMNKQTGETISEEKQARLKAGERTLVLAEIHAPRADYEPRVEVEYPPQ